MPSAPVLSTAPPSRSMAPDEFIIAADAYIAWQIAYAAYVAGLGTPGLGGGDMTGDLGLAAEATVASAATCNIGAAASNRVVITGTTTITSFGTSTNRFKIVRFAGALVLTHNATSLILPGAANITTAAGDMALAVSDGSGNWRVANYQTAAQTTAGRNLMAIVANSGTMPYQSGAGTWSNATLTAWARTLLDDTDAPTARATIGVAPGGFRTATSITAAATTDLGSLASNFALVSGSAVSISSFGSNAAALVAEPIYKVRFATGGHVLVHNATSLILPGGANITVGAGDVLTAEYLGSGNWDVHEYIRADGRGLDGPKMIDVGTIADDGVAIIPYSTVGSMMMLVPDNAAATSSSAFVWLRSIATLGVRLLAQAGTTVAASTAVLAGTTGVDGQVTISANGGNIYIENRSGAARNYRIYLFRYDA